MAKTLQIELSKVIEKATLRGMPAGQYTINVRFLAERDGTISEAKALNDPGYGLARAVVEVVKSGPKWKPGEQDGRKVRSYHTQPISFVITK